MVAHTQRTPGDADAPSVVGMGTRCTALPAAMQRALVGGVAKEWVHPNALSIHSAASPHCLIVATVLNWCSITGVRYRLLSTTTVCAC